MFELKVKTIDNICKYMHLESMSVVGCSVLLRCVWRSCLGRAVRGDSLIRSLNVVLSWVIRWSMMALQLKYTKVKQKA